MNADIAHYLREQTASFSNVPLNSVDALVLCSASYFYLEDGAIGRVNPEATMPLPMAVCGIPREQLFRNSWLVDWNGDALLAALLANPRYAGIDVGYYANIVSDVREEQFSAMTFFLRDERDSMFVAYRGTDDSFAGWKEDFNMAFLETLPSQKTALAYLEGIIDATGGAGPVYVGGHSKGGNIAEYAALTASDQAFSRIEAIYNLDGPCFGSDPSARIHDDDFKRKLHKIVPESSVFGMMLEKRDGYRIIQAQNLGLFQHAPMNWIVRDNDFVTVETLSTDATLFDATMNNWCAGYSPKQREDFIDALYYVVQKSGAKDWTEFDQAYLPHMAKVLAETTKLEPDVRNMVISMFLKVAQIYGNEAFEHIRSKAPVVLPSSLQPRKMELPKPTSMQPISFLKEEESR